MGIIGRLFGKGKKKSAKESSKSQNDLTKVDRSHETRRSVHFGEEHLSAYAQSVGRRCRKGPKSCPLDEMDLCQEESSRRVEVRGQRSILRTRPEDRVESSQNLSSPLTSRQGSSRYRSHIIDSDEESADSRIQMREESRRAKSRRDNATIDLLQRRNMELESDKNALLWEMHLLRMERMQAYQHLTPNYPMPPVMHDYRGMENGRAVMQPPSLPYSPVTGPSTIGHFPTMSPFAPVTNYRTNPPITSTPIIAADYTFESLAEPTIDGAVELLADQADESFSLPDRSIEQRFLRNARVPANLDSRSRVNTNSTRHNNIQNNQ